VENKVTVFLTIHFWKLQPSNGQAFSSITGSDGSFVACLEEGVWPVEGVDAIIDRNTIASPIALMASG
jgi:hypothetical protein